MTDPMSPTNERPVIVVRADTAGPTRSMAVFSDPNGADEAIAAVAQAVADRAEVQRLREENSNLRWEVGQHSTAAGRAQTQRDQARAEVKRLGGLALSERRRLDRDRRALARVKAERDAARAQLAAQGDTTTEDEAAAPETWGDGCECWVTPESEWFRYGSAVEPGSQIEFNPDCPKHGTPGLAREAQAPAPDEDRAARVTRLHEAVEMLSDEALQEPGTWALDRALASIMWDLLRRHEETSPDHDEESARAALLRAVAPAPDPDTATVDEDAR